MKPVWRLVFIIVLIGLIGIALLSNTDASSIVSNFFKQYSFPVFFKW